MSRQMHLLEVHFSFPELILIVTPFPLVQFDSSGDNAALSLGLDC